MARVVMGDTPFRGEPCWIFTGYRNTCGYGVIGTVKNRTSLTHRLAYESLVAPIPDGLTLDHLCRVRACCNPAHLEPVTQRANVLRGAAPAALNAAKTTCIRGHLLPDPVIRPSRPNGTRRCNVCRREQEVIA